MFKKAMVLFVFLAVVAVLGFAQQNPIPDNFVRINGGTFTMGSPANEPGRSDDEVQHQVTVSSFYMGKYEVTQKEWYDVMGTNPSGSNRDNLPVGRVSWFDAVEYCNRRSQREGLTPAYTVNGTNVTWNRNANGYRLPTEAEWEYACRAGTTTAYNTGASINYSTGGWYYDNSDSSHPVGQKPANRWGLHDMHGNVAEWCWDLYGDYSSGSQTDPTGASSGFARVIRGGHFLYGAGGLRSAYRGGGKLTSPNSRVSSAIGFRLVRPYIGEVSREKNNFQATHKVVTNDGTNLRLRDAPGLNTSQIGSLEYGSSVMVLETGASAVDSDGYRGNWTYVSTPDGKTGWCFGAYLQLLPQN